MAPLQEASRTQLLSLPEEIVLMLLNDENGYSHQVPCCD